MSRNICKDGYSIHTNALPEILGQNLWAKSHSEAQTVLKPAGIGRTDGLQIKQSVRSDKISWIDDTDATGAEWIKWAAELQSGFNSSLFLGLFSFESHYALYNPGCFYRTHVDAFQGQKNRILSIIIYLNHDWLKEDGGELVLYADARVPLKVRPEFGTVVAFLSEEVPHEVLVTHRHRYSIAGWFCANRSNPMI